MERNLNKEQRRAVEAKDGPLLIVAGAGTGKTTTLTGRIIHLIKRGIPASKICALTFTNKAAKEMASRVRKEIGGRPLPEGMFMGTFHSFGAKILREECRFLERKRNFVIYDDHDSFQLIKKVVKEELGKKSELTPSFFYEKISQIKNSKLDLADLAASSRPKDKIIRSIFLQYEIGLKKNNAFDFDDLIQKVVFIFEHNPLVLEKHRKRFEHILVDEYQDINPRQYELVSLLAGVHKNLSVVGDDHQMIYGWRYATLETFLNFETEWPGTEVILLEENYRSTGNIISAASALIAQNIHQKEKTLRTKNDPGKLITLMETGTEDDEAEWISETIQTFPETDEVAILYRTNAQSRALEQGLLRHEISYKIYGGIKFYERREIRDIVAALRYVSNRDDLVSRERLEKAFKKSTFRELEADIVAQTENSPEKLINRFLFITDYFAYLEKNTSNPEERRENIAELIYFASQFSDLSMFLEQITLLQATDDAKNETQKPRVQLMTVHLAKGLEFDRVFVAGASEGLLPHARSLDSDDSLEEERRLLYVAMTRAKKELYISFYDLPSRFLGEIPSEFVEFKSLVTDDLRPLDDEERYITLD